MNTDYLMNYEPVRSLIKEMRAEQNTVKAVRIWLNAFNIFNETEKHVGLPDDNDRDGYLAIVCDLRAAGYGLSMAVKTQGIDLEKKAEITPSAFRGCLKALEFDDIAELFGQDEAAMKEIKTYFVMTYVRKEYYKRRAADKKRGKKSPESGA
jgi:hypothetical protein